MPSNKDFHSHRNHLRLLNLLKIQLEIYYDFSIHFYYN